ncbi:MAG: hypothetical protein ABH871_08980 [Pseudomonadota bacterium]
MPQTIFPLEKSCGHRNKVSKTFECQATIVVQMSGGGYIGVSEEVKMTFITIKKELILWIRDALLTASVVFTLFVFIGLIGKEHIESRLISSIPNQEQMIMQQFGFDIFKEQPQTIPKELENQINKTTGNKIDWIERLKKFPDSDLLNIALRWSGIIGLVYRPIKWIRRLFKRG